MNEPEPGLALADNEASIRRYLLGQGSKDETTAIEQRLLTDRSYTNQIELIETELADQYVREALSEADRKRFETHFMASPNRRQKVRIAAALRDRVASSKADPGAATSPASRGWSSAARWAVAAGIVLCLATVALLVGTARLRRDVAALEAQLSQQREQLRELSDQLQQTGQRIQFERERAGSEIAESRIALRDGARDVIADRSGRLSGLESLPQSIQERISSALAAGRITAPNGVAELAGATSVLMGPADGVAFPILSPVGTVVARQQPTLRWGELRGADSYVVSIYDESFQRVAESDPVIGTSWTVKQPLARGITYSWQVTARLSTGDVTSPSKPAPEARFRVLESRGSAVLERESAACKGSHLGLAIVYSRFGLKEDAEHELEILRNQNRGSVLAERLLQSVRSWNGAR